MDYALDWRSLCGHPVPDWFRDAKFGIYTHREPYTVPAYGESSFKQRMHAAEIREVRLLGQAQPLKWRMDWDEGLIIETPMLMPSEYANTFEIRLVERNM